MADRFGSSVLSFTTLRPPDTSRGDSVVHLELAVPPIVAAQVDAWQRGQRDTFTAREAAALLWTLPVATYLDGRIEAWRDVPGITDLDAGLESLIEADAANWPTGQGPLRTLVATAASRANWAALSRALNSASTMDLLNDLVLLFKYAALGRTRPLRRVAELYRLARALHDNPGPSTRAEVEGWLTAPLVVPAAFANGPAPRGPSPIKESKPPSPPRPRSPIIDVTTPVVLGVLAQLDAELDVRSQARRADVLDTALSSAGIRDPALVRRIVTEVTGSDLGAAGDVMTRPLLTATAAMRTPPKQSGGALVRIFLFGTPILIDTAQVRERIARQRRALAEQLMVQLPDRLRERIHGAALSLEDLTVWPDLIPLVEPTPSYLEPVGRSDLLLVRQQTTGYRRTEIAYIENVLIGEKRGRTHTDRVLTRQEFFEGVQRETESTRDLQTTDRSELSKEVSNVVNEDLKVEGSVQVSSRGPTKIVASASASFDRSTEEAATTAEDYARETIERAVKRTLERVTRETRSLFEQEVIEANEHGFERDSKANDHVSGVYQYLERISRAKIFWYGERELYDLIIPEPAALIWQLAISRPEVQIPIQEPDEALFESLTLANIADHLEGVIRQFRVTDIPPQPAIRQEVAFTFSATGGGDDAHHATGKELQIPEGYVVDEATFTATAETEDSDVEPNGGVAVGDQVQLWDMTLTGNAGSATRPFTFSPPLSGPTVAVAMNADNFNSLAGTVTLQLKLTDVAQHAWAATAYGRVAERYEQLRREYAQAVIQAAANRPSEAVNLPAGARAWLQGIVRAELQRNAIDIMRNAPVDYDMITEYPYHNPDGTLGSQPVVDFTASDAETPEVRFLQQAFEWEHVAWIVYPYFWGRRSEWSRMIVTAHPDPDFAAFLNAGAARVQIPVRPGFEDLVKHFMETREVYAGDGLPKMGGPGYVSFIDEQLTTLGAPGDEVAWPPGNPREWDIVAPTPLVTIRSTTEALALPTWNPSTGAEL